MTSFNQLEYFISVYQLQNAKNCLWYRLLDTTLFLGTRMHNQFTAFLCLLALTRSANGAPKAKGDFGNIQEPDMWQNDPERVRRAPSGITNTFSLDFLSFLNVFLAHSPHLIINLSLEGIKPR